MLLLPHCPELASTAWTSGDKPRKQSRVTGGPHGRSAWWQTAKQLSWLYVWSCTFTQAAAERLRLGGVRKISWRVKNQSSVRYVWKEKRERKEEITVELWAEWSKKVTVVKYMIDVEWSNLCKMVNSEDLKPAPQQIQNSCSRRMKFRLSDTYFDKQHPLTAVWSFYINTFSSKFTFR